MNYLRRLWSPPIAAALQTLFLIVTLPIAYHIGVFNEGYFSFGPSRGLVLFGETLDTWPRVLVAYVIIAVMQFVESFSGNVIGPWQTTDVLNIYIARDQTRYPLVITYPVMTADYVYNAINYVVTLHTTLSSIQFIVVRSAVDYTLMCVNVYWCDRMKRAVESLYTMN